MTTTIHANGSKFAGEEPDTIEQLLEVLAAEPLDRSFSGTETFAANLPSRRSTPR